MSGPGFVHLRAHSAYSLLEGALHLKKLIDLAVADDQPALCLADNGNLFGALEFSEKAVQAGLQPLIGCQIKLALATSSDPRAAPPVHPSIVLIARDEMGYANLVEIVSRAYLESDGTTAPFCHIDWFADKAEGLIALTGGQGGPADSLAIEGRFEEAAARLDQLRSVFGRDLYIELQRYADHDWHVTEPFLLDYAYREDVAIVATNEAFFADKDDYEAHDALICLAEGRVLIEDDRRHLTPDHRFKGREEMIELFKDLPEALEASVEIARRCSYRPKTRPPILPRFTAETADGALTEADELRRQAREGLDRRLEAGGLAPGTTRDDYVERLEFELSVIERMDYPGYFLIVSDFIKWAKAEGIPVGPGRGSGAASVVAWSLTITDLDPLQFGLLFERFLNPERVSMPDFDIDFCQDRRGEVIRYVQEKYGKEQVAQIITFGSLQARAVLRDVGRVLQMPYGQVDRLCKMVPNNPANPVTLVQAIGDEPRLQEERDKDEIVARLFSIAIKLEGLYRHASTHAAGIVIGDRPLEKLVPLYRDSRSDMPATQFNLKWVEPAGLVKFDFLGLKTLTVIDRTLQFIREQGIDIDLDTIPFDDKKTYEMISRGETVGVFQLESQGMRKALAGMKPDRFEDIVALVALYRPGPMDNIPTYNRRKHNEEEPDYMHPLLEPILTETFGVIIYQEQVMQIAQTLSGYSLGEADLLRRAMGKKIRAEMAVQRERFVEGAVERQVDKAQAETIFDLVAKFADYGFNKAHAAAYAFVSYQTAFLKANYPVEFLAASMSLDITNTDKLNDFRQEARRLEIEVRPPSIAESEVDFTVSDGRIVYALAAIKGVGRHAVETLVEERRTRPFASLSDFANRLNPKAVNKKTLEGLIAAGALDCLDANRARLMNGLERVLETANRTYADAQQGQSGLFGDAVEGEAIHLPDVQPWPAPERLQHEHAAIGFYFSAHPLDEYRSTLEKLRVQDFASFSQSVRAGATAGRIAGTVVRRQERKTKTGNKMGIIYLTDPSGQFEAVAFSEVLTTYRPILSPGESVVLMVGAEQREEGISIRIQAVQSLEEASAGGTTDLRIFLREAEPLASVSKYLRTSGPVGVSVILLLQEPGKEVEVRLPEKYDVSPKLASALRAVNGVVSVELT
ncbi:MAG: DNA polymerase III subunit alpha [Pseudomonadota bacterium]